MSAPTVSMTVGAEIAVSGLSPAAEATIIRANTIANPDFARRERLNLWTGGTPETIALYRRTPTGLIVPRGTYPILVKVCRDHGLPFTVDDRTVRPPLDETFLVGQLWPYQERALDDLLRYPTGVLEAPTGSGKTNILLSVIPVVDTPTLILVHTTELLKQMRDRCASWLGIEAGVMGAGKTVLRPVTIGMLQTLARRDLDGLAPLFGCVLMDECHHAPARTYAPILDALPARYKFGFSATAWRKDRLETIMFRSLGPITARVTPSEVNQAGRTIAPEIETVQTSFYYDLTDPTEWTAMITALVENGSRNALIAAEVRDRLRADRHGLILSDRIDHVDRLADGLADLDPIVLTGDMPKKDRDAAMAEVRAGARLTIATSSLLGEGVDVPGWDLLFLATPMAGGPRTLQAIGRVSRAAPGKDRATVVDFVDWAVPALAGAHSQRERLYERAS